LIALAACFRAPSAIMAEDEFGKRLPASLVLFGWLEMGFARSFASVGMKGAFGESGLGYCGLCSMAHKLEEQTLVRHEWRPIQPFRWSWVPGSALPAVPE
jgi:hypothetical protein